MSHTPIQGLSAWTGAELVGRTDWIHQLTTDEIADIERIVAVVRATGTPREQLTRADVAFRALAPALAAWRAALDRGRGFVLARGLPVDRMSAEEAVI